MPDVCISKTKQQQPQNELGIKTISVMKTKTKEIILKLFVGLVLGFFVGCGVGKLVKDQPDTASKIERTNTESYKKIN